MQGDEDTPHGDDSTCLVTPEATPEAKQHRKRAGGSYFAVDMELAERALGIGIEAFLALLVMARGTGGDQRTTKWGAHSIETREILGRHTAKRAIRSLEMMEMISRPTKNGIRKIADRTIVGRDGQGKDVYAPRIWLPNQLVDGPPGRRSPLVALRETRSEDAALLLMRLYAVCDLEQWGGVPPALLRGDLRLEALGDRDMHRIFGINPNWHWREAPDLAQIFAGVVLVDGKPGDSGQGDRRLWSAFGILNDLKLLEWACYILDGPPSIGEPIAPCGWGRESEEAYFRAMDAAARQMITRPLRGAKKQGDALKGYKWFAAIPRHVSQPHCVVLIRPRLLPDTALTRRWLARLERWRERAAEWGPR